MYTIEEQLAEWLTNLTGVYVLPEKDKDLNSELLNQSHGVLRLISDDHGVNDEFYTESAGYAVDFVILKEESEKFVNTMHVIATKYNTVDLTKINDDEGIAFSNGIKGKFYYTNCLINGDIESANGNDMMSYQMTFNLSLFESLIPADDSTISINNDVLKGVINVVPSFSVEKEGFVSNGTALPKYETTSKSQVIQIQYMPLDGNRASDFLLKKMNTLDTNSFDAVIKWPSSDNPIVNISGKFFLKDITLNLVKGNFAGVNATLVREG